MADSKAGEDFVKVLNPILAIYTIIIGIPTLLGIYAVIVENVDPLFVVLIIVAIIIFLLLFKHIKSFVYLTKIGFMSCGKLKRTDYKPGRFIKKTSTGFDFIGVCGKKWISDENIDEFKKMLIRVRNQGKKVRFLIIAEGSEYHETLKNNIHAEPCVYEKWRELVNQYRGTLEVKCYDHVPIFRLLISNDKGIISTYDLAGDNRKDDGMSTPHLLFKNIENLSFQRAMVRFFENEWKNAKFL